MKTVDISTSELVYSIDSKAMTGEISDLINAHLSLLGRRLTQVTWRIKSHRTGAMTTWDYHSELVENDEVVGWVFKPTLQTWTAYPQLADHRFIIFND